LPFLIPLFDNFSRDSFSLFFTIEPEVYENFEKIIPSNTKSRVIEFFIIEFLRKTKSEQASILAQINKLKKPQPKGVLNND